MLLIFQEAEVSDSYRPSFFMHFRKHFSSGIITITAGKKSKQNLKNRLIINNLHNKSRK